MLLIAIIQFNVHVHVDEYVSISHVNFVICMYMIVHVFLRDILVGTIVVIIGYEYNQFSNDCTRQNYALT